MNNNAMMYSDHSRNCRSTSSTNASSETSASNSNSSSFVSDSASIADRHSQQQQPQNHRNYDGGSGEASQSKKQQQRRTRGSNQNNANPMVKLGGCNDGRCIDAAAANGTFAGFHTSSSSSSSSSSSAVVVRGSDAVHKNGTTGAANFNSAGAVITPVDRRRHQSHGATIINPAAAARNNGLLFEFHRVLQHFIIPCRRRPPADRRRLLFEPSRKLYFPYEPGKQSRSAVRIKNVSTSPIAFKFQTTAPRSCLMRPPNGVLSPGESIVVTVFKYIDLNGRSNVAPQQIAAKTATRNKFKIVSLKLEEGIEFTPDLFEAQKEAVVVEQVLQVVLLNPSHPSPELQALKALLVEADATAHDTQTKSQGQNHQKLTTGMDALEEWKKQKLAREKAKHMKDENVRRV